MHFHIIDDSVEPWWKVAIDVFTPLASLAVIVLAIYGDYIKMWLSGPKCRIRLRDPAYNESILLNGEHVLYVILNVENLRAIPATNCRVLAEKVERQQVDLSFADLKIPYPLHLKWSPSEQQPPLTLQRAFTAEIDL